MEADIRRDLEAGLYRRAFEKIVDRFQYKVFRLAFGMLREKGMAEDTAQEVFLKVWRALPKYSGKASLSTWIYAITRNAALDAIRHAAARKTTSLDHPAQGEPVEKAGASDGAFHRAMVSDMHRMIDRLPESYRRVIVLFYLEEKSYEEVSKMLALPMGTVKSHLHRAKKELARFAEEGRKGAEKIKESNHGLSGL